MRKKLLVANWKMQGDRQFAKQYFADLLTAPIISQLANQQVIIIPPYTLLADTEAALSQSTIIWGAQNVASETNGAFTGEISASMLIDLHCQYVLIGHSERRQLFNETNAILEKKLRLSLETGLQAIFCVGETLAERDADLTEQTIQQQLQIVLKLDYSAEIMQNIAVAYEPIWAIGTGRSANPQQAQTVHASIRHLFANNWGNSLAEQLNILYGGSVKANNAADLFKMPDIDGALVGGASLNIKEFLEIIKCSKLS